MSYTIATLQPLIGGAPIAAEAVFGVSPEWAAGWMPWNYDNPEKQPNDQYYMNYMHQRGKNIPYFDLNKEDQSKEAWNVDLLISVPLCSGVSSMNMAACSTAKQNENMKMCMHYGLGEIKPRVMLWENSNYILSDKFSDLMNELIQIANSYGYRLTAYNSRSRLHGNPQYRARAWMYLTPLSEPAPKWDFWRREPKGFEEILRMPKVENDPMLKEPFGSIGNSDFMDSPDFAVLAHLFGGKDAVFENIKNYADLYGWCQQNLSEGVDKNDKRLKSMEKYRELLIEIGWNQKAIDKEEYRINKVRKGQNFWQKEALKIAPANPETPILFNSFTGSQLTTIIDGNTKQFITYRDALRVMGMPDDFNMIHPNDSNYIAQNVDGSPNGITADMCKNVKKYLDGDAEFVDIPYDKVLVADNTSKTYHLLGDKKIKF